MFAFSNPRFTIVGGDADAREFERFINVIWGATASRVGFSALAAIVAYVGAHWTLAPYWFVAMALWEWPMRPALEANIGRALERIGARQAFVGLALVQVVGAMAYGALPVSSWASDTSIGQVLAAVWLCGVASHVLVYFSDNRFLLTANLAPCALTAVCTPLLVGHADGLERVLGSVVLISILGATAVFARDRNVLLKSLFEEVEARKSAESANEAKGQFLSIISHELKTPLNAVVGYAEMLSEDLTAKGEPELKDDADKILASGRQLLGLINRIILLARLESGSVVSEPLPTDLRSVLGHAVEAARPIAEANGNRISMEAGDLGIGAVDPEKLVQCIAELCANAAKFTRRGEVIVRAERVGLADGDTLQVDVIDNGVGIDKAVAEKIFQPFVQGQSRADRQFEGAGAGLAIVQALVRVMGGSVRFSHRTGGGAVFTLSIPFAPVDADSGATTSVSALAAGA